MVIIVGDYFGRPHPSSLEHLRYSSSALENPASNQDLGRRL